MRSYSILIGVMLCACSHGSEYALSFLQFDFMVYDFAECIDIVV